MSNLTVGMLRKMLENVPDDTPVLTEFGDRNFYQAFISGTGYTTALEERRNFYNEDIYLTESGEDIGEETDLGVRKRVFIVQ